MMKPSANIINTARGGIIDEGALVEALGEGRIAGAAVHAQQQDVGAGRRKKQSHGDEDGRQRRCSAEEAGEVAATKLDSGRRPRPLLLIRRWSGEAAGRRGVDTGVIHDQRLILTLP